MVIAYADDIDIIGHDYSSVEDLFRILEYKAKKVNIAQVQVNVDKKNICTSPGFQESHYHHK